MWIVPGLRVPSTDFVHKDVQTNCKWTHAFLLHHFLRPTCLVSFFPTFMGVGHHSLLSFYWNPHLLSSSDPFCLPEANTSLYNPGTFVTWGEMRDHLLKSTFSVDGEVHGLLKIAKRWTSLVLGKQPWWSWYSSCQVSTVVAKGCAECVMKSIV